MIAVNKTIREALLALVAVCLSRVAFGLPGIEISDSIVDADAKRWVDYAVQLQPDVFAGASTWRDLDSIHIKYFADSDVFVGVTEGQLYLLGGPYGDDIVHQGTAFDAAEAMLVSTLESVRTLPGTAISTAVIGENAKALVDLVIQLDPATFASPTTWRYFSGLYYRFFQTSGIAVAFSGADLYVLGGPFGDSLTNLGPVVDAITALQGGNNEEPQPPFAPVLTGSTFADLLDIFNQLTIRYRTTTSSFDAENSVALTVVGQEMLGGVQTTRVNLTLSGTNAPVPVHYQMWVNAAGTVVNLVQNEFSYGAASAAVGSSLVSGMLLALAQADSPLVRNEIAAAMADSEVFSQSVENRVAFGMSVRVLTIEVAATGTSFVTEVSDFGDFAMVTKYTGSITNVLGTTTNSYEVTEMQLK